MDDAFRSGLDAKLADLRAWAGSHRFSGCRFVQYCGFERVGALDLAPAEAEAQVVSLLCGGFRVGWAEHDGRLYLRVWEFDGPEPPWPKVFAEEHLADVGAIVREARGTV